MSRCGLPHLSTWTLPMFPQSQHLSWAGSPYSTCWGERMLAHASIPGEGIHFPFSKKLWEGHLKSQTNS